MDHRADPHKRRITGEPPIERFARERDKLRPLPPHPYDTADVGYRVVDVYGFVLWETTPYSVPYGYLLDIVAVHATTDEVFVYNEQLQVSPATSAGPTATPSAQSCPVTTRRRSVATSKR